MTAGVDAAMTAYAEQQAAITAAEEAEDRLAQAVAALRDVGQSVEAIAALTDVPLTAVRSARRRGAGGVEDGEEPPAVPVPASSSTRAERGRRQPRPATDLPEEQRAGVVQVDGHQAEEPSPVEGEQAQESAA